MRARSRHGIKPVAEAVEVKFLVEAVNDGPVRLELGDVTSPGWQRCRDPKSTMSEGKELEGMTQ